MIAAPFLLALVLPLAGQCLARTIEGTKEVDAQKRDVNFLRCLDLWDEDVVHITTWSKEPVAHEQMLPGSDLLQPRSDFTHMLDSRDLQPDVITQELLEKREQEITAQDPLYLGTTGEKDKHGNDVLGQVSSADDAPSFQFLVCPANDFMNYQPLISSDGMEVVYGHLALSSDPTKCVMPASLKKRNAPLVLKPCPVSEDGKQFEAYFRFTRYEQREKGITTILRYMEFLGKPNRSVPNHFQANYTIRFEQSSKKVFVDGRHPNEKKGKGEQSVFSFNNRRKAK